MQTTDDIRSLLKQMFDQAIVRHGFVDYNRDYDVVVKTFRRYEAPRVDTFRFRGCVEVEYRSLVLPQAFSLNDELTEMKRWEAAGNPDGYVWGAKFTDAYPGAEYVEESPRAAGWKERLGVPVHEVTIETGIYLLSLVFHDLHLVPMDADTSTASQV